MKPWGYVLKLVAFAFKANPLFYASIAISLVSVVVELLAMSSLFPLLQIVSGAAAPNEAMIVRGLAALGVSATPRSLLWTFVALFALRILTQLTGQSLSMYLGKRVLAQLASQAFEQIIHKLSIREINEQSIGFHVNLAGDESFRASTLVVSLTTFINTFVLAVLYFGAIALSSPGTAGLVFAFLVVSSLALLYVLRWSRELGAQQTVESRKANSIFLDSLNNLKAVRAFSAEAYVARIYRSTLFGYTKILFLIDEITLLAKLVPVLILLLIFGLWLFLSSRSLETAGIAFIVTTIVYLMRFFPTTGEAAHLLFKIVTDAKSGKDVTTILGSTAPGGTRHLSPGPINALRLQGLGFSFRAGDRKILADLSTTFERGKSYALVGRSGIGKSTLVDLILKFYPPTEGMITLNDQSTADVLDTDIRKKILLVGSEPAIFDDTVTNNVCLGMAAAPDDVRAACDLARIGEFVATLESGYETRLQYQGRNLSAGQRQRIAIARALLRKPDILILDESTNALDKGTQEQIVHAILREYSNRIVIFITHDPSIMSCVDHVADLATLNAAATGSAENAEQKRDGPLS